MSFRRHLTSQSHCSCTCWVPHHCGWPAECSLEWCAASCSPAEENNILRQEWPSPEHAKDIFGTHKCSQYLSDGKTIRGSATCLGRVSSKFQDLCANILDDTRQVNTPQAVGFSNLQQSQKSPVGVLWCGYLPKCQQEKIGHPPAKDTQKLLPIGFRMLSIWSCNSKNTSAQEDFWWFDHPAEC